MNTLLTSVTPRNSVFDKGRRDVVLDVTDLIEDKISPEDFFEENFITRGMAQLYQSVMMRLEGRSDDGIFLLSQSMGGGKTHNLITVGLAAKYPEFRSKAMKEVYDTPLADRVKVIGFSGRETPNLGLWGYIAEQLGKKSVFDDYYQPLQAPGQSAWLNLLKGEQVLILLDELPPYLQAVGAKVIGSTDLSHVTTTALANLFAAMGKPELKNVAIVLTDLSSTNYKHGSSLISEALGNLQNETRRLSKTFIPVDQTDNELYDILRKRLFERLPSTSEIASVAEAFGTSIEDARKMDLITDSRAAFAKAVEESYPFHPSLKDLCARFKENQGFQQTRGLIKLMRTIVSAMFDPTDGWADESLLISPCDVEFADPDTLTEITGINSSLTNAISHDIFSSGEQSAAQLLDNNFGGKIATDTAKLILFSSLATVQSSVRGLKDTEIIRNLVAPGRDVTKVKEVLAELKSSAWYLHIDSQGRFFFKDVQNVVAKLNNLVGTVTQEIVRQSVKKKLEEVFAPQLADCYQKVYALTALDEIKIEPDKVALVIYTPHSGGLHPDLQKLFEDTQFQNRVLFLTGESMPFNALEQNAKYLKAVEDILAEYRSENVPTNDVQFRQAEELRDQYQHRFNASLTETFIKIFYPVRNASDPTRGELLDRSLNLHFKNNRLEGEAQITASLKDAKKFEEDVTSDVFQKKIESILFANQDQAPWSDIKRRAATNTRWTWHKPSALDQIKDRLLQQDLWRANGDLIRKGPFPPPATDVSVREVSRNEDTGELKLRVTPRFGDKVHYEINGPATTGSNTIDFSQDFATTEMRVSFLCVDSKNEHDQGPAIEVTNRLTLKYRIYAAGSDMMCELQPAPAGATVRYTCNGADPSGSSAATYDGPFIIPPGTTLIQAIGEKAGIKSEIRSIKPPEKGAGPYTPDLSKPAIYTKALKLQSTSDVFQWLKLAQKHRIKAAGLSVATADSNDKYVQLETGQGVAYDPDKLSQILEFFQTRLQVDGELTLDVARLLFETGQHLLDYIRDRKETLDDGSKVQQ